MPKKQAQVISKHLHVTKDGLQVIDYQKLFQKKLRIDPIDVHAELAHKLKQLPNAIEPKVMAETPDVRVFGGFENANILHATIHQREINILLNADTNTNGCTHWFYFALQSQESGCFKIKVLNNRRRSALFTRGNHIHVSHGDANWTSNTGNTFYYRTNINHPYYYSDHLELAQLQEKMELHTLEFTMELHAKQFTRVAMNLPYTVQDLLNLERQLITNRTNVKVIGKSPLGLPILRVKFKKHTYFYQGQFKFRSSTQSIVVLARQHPSETAGSHICDALLRQLSRECNLPYRVVVFPMVNPDGVFLGNSRCNWHGVDLNRKWDIPDATAPEVLLIKRHIEQLNSKYPVQFMIDLHGHSSEMNQFIYGCSPENISSFFQYIQTKLFARLLQRDQPYFEYKVIHKPSLKQSCRFRVTQSKRTTARVSFHQQFGILNSLTVETSFFGFIKQDHPVRFTSEHYTQMASNLERSLSDYQSHLIRYIQSNGRVTAFPRTKQEISARTQDTLFQPDELKRVAIHLAKGVNPVEKEPLPDSDSEAETDLKPKFRLKHFSQFNYSKSPEQQETSPPVIAKQFFAKVKTVESEERQSKTRQPRSKELAHLHFIDFSDSMNNNIIPRVLNSQCDTLDGSTTKGKKVTPLHNTFLRRSVHTRRKNLSFDIRISRITEAQPSFAQQHSRSILIEKISPLRQPLSYYGLSYTSCSNGQAVRMLQAQKIEPISGFTKALRKMNQKQDA